MGSNHIHTDGEIDDKLSQYMLINKQISKTLTKQRTEISNLKNSLVDSSSENMRLKMENHKWKNKFHVLRKIYIEHIQSITSELQSNADKINSLSDGEGIGNENESSNSLARRSLENPSKSTDNSRRLSKSFELAKSRSTRTITDILEMGTIDEESLHELLEEMDEDKTGMNETRDDENFDDSQEEGDTLEGSENSNEVSEESDEESSSDEDWSDDEQETIMKNKKSIPVVANGKGVRAATLSIGEDSSSDEYESASADDSSSDEEESSPVPRIPIAVSKGTTNSKSVESKKGEEKSVESEEGTEIENEDQSSDEDCRSGSVEQISLLTTNYESTIKNDESNKENERSSAVDASISTHSIRENSQSVVSVDGQSFDKSSTLRPLKQLQLSKKIVTESVNGSQREINEKQTFGPLKVKSLISSTPYRNNNISSSTAVEIAIASPALSTRSRSAVISMESQVTVTNGSQLSATSMSSRPRRKAAPVMLSEPKLNTKLRRPR